MHNFSAGCWPPKKDWPLNWGQLNRSSREYLYVANIEGYYEIEVVVLLGVFIMRSDARRIPIGWNCNIKTCINAKKKSNWRIVFLKEKQTILKDLNSFDHYLSAFSSTSQLFVSLKMVLLQVYILFTTLVSWEKESLLVFKSFIFLSHFNYCTKFYFNYIKRNVKWYQSMLIVFFLGKYIFKHSCK